MRMWILVGVKLAVCLPFAVRGESTADAAKAAAERGRRSSAMAKCCVKVSAFNVIKSIN